MLCFLVLAMSVVVVQAESARKYKLEKTEALCRDLDGNVIPVEDVSGTEGTVYCDYDMLVEQETETSLNRKWHGKREVYIDGNLVEKYNMAQRWNINKNAAILWQATADVNEDGTVTYCTSKIQASNDVLHIYEQNCETEVLDGMKYANKPRILKIFQNRQMEKI